MKLWLRQPLINFDDLDAVVSYPPGYWKAFVFNIAVEWASEIGKNIPAEVLANATASKAELKRLNTVTQYKKGDGGMGSSKPNWNYITGAFTPWFGG
jgi:hypothetical protein